MDHALVIALSLLLRYSPLPLPTPEEVLSPPAQALEMSDEALQQRALDLLDPYTSLIPVWQGGAKSLFTCANAKKGLLPKNYSLCLDFPSQTYLKALTAQQLTQAACQALYQTAPADLFQELDGQLYWNEDAYLEELPPAPLWAELQARSDQTATLLAAFDDGSQGTVELRLEQGQWKLQSCPLLPNVDGEESPAWDGRFSDRELEQRALSLFAGRDNCAPDWWLQAAAVLNQTWGEGPDLPEEASRWGGYYLIQRFPTMEQLQQATEQQLTQDYAQLFYDNAVELDLFREVEGRLYGADSMQSLAINRTSRALVLRRGRDWALLLMAFGGVEGFYAAPVELRLEQGQWKVHSSPFDRFLSPKRDGAVTLWPWTGHHAS